MEKNTVCSRGGGSSKEGTDKNKDMSGSGTNAKFKIQPKNTCHEEDAK